MSLFGPTECLHVTSLLNLNTNTHTNANEQTIGEGIAKLMHCVGQKSDH